MQSSLSIVPLRSCHLKRARQQILVLVLASLTHYIDSEGRKKKERLVDAPLLFAYYVGY